MFYYEKEIQCITAYVSIVVINRIQAEILNIFPDLDAVAEMKKAPLYSFQNIHATGVVNICMNYYRKWDNDEISSNWLQMTFVIISSTTNFVLHLAYDTVYYYFLPFAPVFLIFYSRIADARANAI